MTSFAQQYFEETIMILRSIDHNEVEKLAGGLREVRDRGGRLFVLGVGGSAANASHAVNDFRKICELEAYAPTDNVAELTARVNDEGWDTSFAEWLKGSRLNGDDGLLVFSVGGGSVDQQVSMNLVLAVELAKDVGARVFGIVGKDGGATAAGSDACVIIPPLSPNRITPHTEGLCSVVAHLIVSHPALHARATKWESVAAS